MHAPDTSTVMTVWDGRVYPGVCRVVYIQGGIPPTMVGRVYIQGGIPPYHGTREAYRVVYTLSPMVPGRHIGVLYLSHDTREACWVYTTRWMPITDINPQSVIPLFATFLNDRMAGRRRTLCAT